MVSAGQDLLSHRGHRVTMLDVIQRADAPRGSIYHHFPKGKEELAIEVARKVARELEEFVAHTSAKVPDATAFLQRVVGQHQQRLVSSNYELGSPLMGMLANGDPISAELDTAVAEAFTTWTGAITRALMGKGIPPERADRLAMVVVSGIEGAIMHARATRSPAPFTELGRSLPTLVAG